jgi:predicted PurR-regulated permease PerM
VTTPATAPVGAPPKRFPALTPPSRPAVVAAIGVAVVAVLIYLVGETLATFVIGLILILVLDPLVTWLTAKGIPRALSAILSIALLAVVVLVFGYVVISAILHQGPAFLQAIGDSLASIRDWVAASGLPSAVKDAVAAVFVRLDEALASLDVVVVVEGFLAAVGGLLGPILGLVLVLPFFMFYVLSDRPRLASMARRSIPAQWRGDVLHLAAISIGSFTTYIRAEALLMAILGTITFVGLLLVGTIVEPEIRQYALFLGVIAAFSELIPMFGPYIALIPAIVFTMPLGIGPVVAVLLLYLVIMFLEGNVLVPKIEGGKFELHPALVIVLVLAGLALLGPLGAVLAMPVTAMGRDAFRYVFERASGLPQPTVDDEGRIVEPGTPPAAPPEAVATD